ncbi:DUF4191 domain-containing protein [Actinomyces vulturis]|uniref:DUF4191 domain-containing protein n=1 Tax=Actinomyces vulturis TaxID=1857645 RepID=UPI0008304596|nr:DUF4191 domain-containing protein [Actinomyces vulturis]
MSTQPTPKPKKERKLALYFRNLKDSYTISRRTFPWVGWAMLGAFVAFVALGVAIAASVQQPLWYWALLGVLIGFTADLMILSWTVRRASYSQIEGHPGATKAVLDQIRRGWNIDEEPCAINPKTRDIVWRAVGRPGVVLLAEGPSSRTTKMLQEEKRKVNRIIPTVPVHTLQVGTSEGQVRLIDLEKTMRRLPTKPTKLTPAEIVQVAQRLRSLGAKGLPIPKGIDPNAVRPNRRAMRGR